MKLKIRCFNVRSICNKAAEVIELLLEQNIDICCISETWLKANDNTTLVELQEHGFGMFSNSRESRGGGTAVLFRNTLPFIQQTTAKFSSVEVTETLFKLKSQSNVIVPLLYHTCIRTTKASINAFLMNLNVI